MEILRAAIRGCMSPEKKTGKAKIIGDSFVAPKNYVVWVVLCIVCIKI